MRFAFLFYDGMTALDMIGPHEILSRLPGVNSVRVAKRKGPVSTDSGVALVATEDFTNVRHADFLFIPGAASATSMIDDADTLDWIRTLHKGSTWTT